MKNKRKIITNMLTLPWLSYHTRLLRNGLRNMKKKKSSNKIFNGFWNCMTIKNRKKRNFTIYKRNTVYNSNNNILKLIEYNKKLFFICNNICALFSAKSIANLLLLKPHISRFMHIIKNLNNNRLYEKDILI